MRSLVSHSLPLDADDGIGRWSLEIRSCATRYLTSFVSMVDSMRCISYLELLLTSFLLSFGIHFVASSSTILMGGV